MNEIKRPQPEPKENIGKWQGKKHSHILIDGSNCQVLNSKQWETIQDTVLELQKAIGVNFMTSFFEIDDKL